MRSWNKLWVLIAVAFVPVMLYGQWAKTYTGINQDIPVALIQTPEGVFLCAGYMMPPASSLAEEVTGWLVRISSNGGEAERWDFHSHIPDDPGYDRPEDRFFAFHSTADGGYILGGSTGGRGGEDPEGQQAPGARGYAFGFMLKLNSNLESEWQQVYGSGDGQTENGFRAIRPTADGGYVAVGFTTSFGVGRSDFLVVKMDTLGQIVWQKSYGGVGDEEADLVEPLPDGGFLVVGSTDSFGSSDSLETPLVDIWALRLTSEGDIVWQKAFSFSPHDTATCMAPTQDGAFLIGGSILVDRGEDVEPDSDILLLKLDLDGIVVLQRAFGESRNEWMTNLINTPESKFMAVGGVESNDNQDLLIMQLADTVSMDWLRSFGAGAVEGGISQEFAAALTLTENGEIVVAGSTSHLGSEADDLLLLRMSSDGHIPNCEQVGMLTLLPQRDLVAVPQDTFVEFTAAGILPQNLVFSSVLSTVDSILDVCAPKKNLIRR
jgi:hypothetical protein